MNSLKYQLIIDVNGDQFLIDSYDNIESAKLMAKKVFEMASPPQVFAMNELIRIYEILNCQKVIGDILENSIDLETNGVISVFIIEKNKMEKLNVMS
tara:strand:- start:383 stop:673 length:291 start_codon:yes stop_codon:yes gene_type:complete